VESPSLIYGSDTRIFHTPGYEAYQEYGIRTRDFVIQSIIIDGFWRRLKDV